MNKKHFYAVILSMSLVVIGIQPAFGIKYIIDDGVDGTGGDASSIGIWDWENLTCTLTQDVSEGIEIMDDGITLDGDGHAVTGTGSELRGISLEFRRYVTVKNLKVEGFVTGISLCNYHSSDHIDLYKRDGYNTIEYNTISSNGTGINVGTSNWNTVTNNTVSTCDYGIHLAGSRNNTVTENTVRSSSEKGIYLNQGMQGSVWIGSDENTLTGNTVTGVSITQGNGIYIQHCNTNTVTGNTIASNEYGIKLWSCSNISVTGNNISNNYWGIHLYTSNNNEITGNNVTDNAGGIWLDTSCYENNLTSNTVLRNGPGIYLRISSNNNTLTDNTASNNDDGIKLDNSNSNNLTGNTANANTNAGIWLMGLEGSNLNILTGNTASNNKYGIKLENSSDNTLTGNDISDNDWGIWIDPSNNNTMIDNDISNNIQGIYILNSSYNKVYNNNFLSNTTQASVTGGSDNDFDFNGSGNYWSDRTGSGPYTFTGGQDNFPLVHQDGEDYSITINIQEAKVSWDHSDIHVEGNLYLPEDVHMDDVNPRGNAVITLAEVEVANQCVDLEITGKNDDKWQYKDKENLYGPIKEFKIDWKGAKFDYKGDNKFHIHTHFISGTETTLCIHCDHISGAFTLNIDDTTDTTTISYDADRIITTDVDYEPQKDDNTHVHFTLPFQLTSDNMTIEVSGAVKLTINVADYYEEGFVKFKLVSAFDSGSFSDGSATLSDKLESVISLGDMISGSDLIGEEKSWTNKDEKQWNYNW